MSNLFFAKVENKQVHYPPEWKQVEISPLLENRELATSIRDPLSRRRRPDLRR